MMTRKEAIEILQGAIKKPNTKDGYLGQAIDIAIKALKEQEPCDMCDYATSGGCQYDDIAETIPTEGKPCDDAGEISDGYHTFNQLYHQRAILFATIVNEHPDISWKSFKHSDGHYCFDEDGEMFIVGIDTPEGSYTYHYHKKYWDLFKCKELERGKKWDGHTEKDVTRLLSLEQEPKKGYWIKYSIPRCGEQHYKCTSCGYYINFGQWGELYTKEFKYCPNCGADMRGELSFSF